VFYSQLTRARRGNPGCVWGWGGKNKYHTRQKRLLMDPLNNQPNSLFVCKVRTFSIKSRLNIGLRVGSRAQEEAVIALVLFLPLVIRTLPAWNRWPPSALWEQIGVLFNQGLICKFHTSPAV
jgi:hypothetical protein